MKISTKDRVAKTFVWASLFNLSISFPVYSASLVPSSGVISESGDYRLSSGLIASGRFTIRIDVSSVELDLGGHTVRCAPADPNTAETYGIMVRGDDVTIRNGEVSGCYMGGYAVPGARNVRWESIRFNGNRYVNVTGGSVFVGNMFADTKGHSAGAYTIGINLPSGNCVISSNVFRNLHRRAGDIDETPGEGIGVIFSPGSAGCIARHNWHENSNADHLEIGYWVGDATVTIEENAFTNIGRGIAVAPDGKVAASNNRFWMRTSRMGSYAIGAQHGKAVGNVIIGYDNPIDGNIVDTDSLILP